MKKLLWGILLGNILHFGLREIGGILKAQRARDCRRHSQGELSCKEATWLENILLLEMDLGGKVFGDN